MESKLFLSLICLILIQFSQQISVTQEEEQMSVTQEDEQMSVTVTQEEESMTTPTIPTTQSEEVDQSMGDLMQYVDVTTVNLEHQESTISDREARIERNTLLLRDIKKDPYYEIYAQNCKEVQARGYNKTDLYFIKPLHAPKPFLVLCDMNTRGGGWTTIFRRYDGSQVFDLDWENYKHGFGRLREEFWLGLEKIRIITGLQLNELLIEVSDRLPGENPLKRDHYKFFSIGNEAEGYIIKLLEDYEGDAGNAFSDSYGAKFSTKDKNLDSSFVDKKCAVSSGGGWWHKDCASILLTAKWDIYSNTMSWQETRMLIRPSPAKLN